MNIILARPAGVRLHGRLSSNVRRHQVHHDLTLIADLCSELSIQSHLLDDSLHVTLQPSIVLTFKNYVENGSPECLIAFEGTAWHAHGDLIDLSTSEYEAKVNGLDVITGLSDGALMLRELWSGEHLVDRWLVHRNWHEDGARYLSAGEDIRLRRLNLLPK